LIFCKGNFKERKRRFKPPLQLIGRKGYGKRDGEKYFVIEIFIISNIIIYKTRGVWYA